MVEKASTEQKKSHIDISVVIPVYGCPGATPELHRRLVKTLEGMHKSFEIIMVNDCDPYDSWSRVRKVCEEDPRVIGLNLSRNFGQAQAITAGLDHSSGDWVVVMDCDLQDRPESIEALYNKAQEGYDVVFAKRVNRKDSKSTRFFSRMFYKVYDYFTDGTYDPSYSNFSIAARKVVDSYCSMREHHRAYTMFIRWLGFNETAIPLEGDERFEGKSSYNFKKKMRLAIELITAQSNKPLHFAVDTGLIFAFLGFLFLLYLIIRYCIDPAGSPMGWTSSIGAVFLMGGLNLAAIGIAGIYIGHIFVEVKNRPIYVISEHLND